MEFAAAAEKAPTHSVEHTMDQFDSGSISHGRPAAWKSFFNPRRASRKPDDSVVITHTAEKSASSSDDITRLEHVDTSATTMTAFEAQGQTGDLYRDGQLVLMPAPTRDPKDPLNMTTRHKILCCISLCCFGALAAAAELILGAMLPVFALEYANPHINPQDLPQLSTVYAGQPIGTDPLDFLNNLGGPPIWEVYLLASLPVLMIGLSNLILIPLAISIGRRPVILGTGVIAICGCLWAGGSQSLGSHLGARCVQALGAGTVESLIPFVLQDMVFIHQRNTWISGIFAAQGAIIIAIGFAAPYIIVYLTWRWVYFITAAGAGFFLIGCVFFMPETRYQRTRAEMQGTPREDFGVEYSPRTFKGDMALITGGIDWRKGWKALIDTLLTFFYPQIFFITMLNSAMIAAAFAAAYTVAPNLLVRPWLWPFLHLGFLLVPVLISAIFVGVVTGKMADVLANWAAKKRGRRVPENQLINLVLPTVCGLIGCIVYGVAGANPGEYHWAVFLFALGLMTFGFLGANTVGAVYVLECYPHLAGPALVNIASFRCLIAFVLSFKVSEWIVELGYYNSFMIYTGIMAAFSALIPVVWIWGPAWRRRWPATNLGDH